MGANTSRVSTHVPTQEHSKLASPRPLDAWADLDYKLSGSSFVRTKERIQCAYEGGHQCINEDPACQQAASAFQGLHSSWVTPQVLAMARPWQENLLKHNIAQAFQDAGIGMVLNLQEVGEHAHCGRGVLPSCGFSYDPEAFMAAGIGVYNFSWRDMGIPTLQKMMDIVQVMVHVTEEEHRKVAVHCHAGLGRTGLAIACYLVFLGDCDAHGAVSKVRQGRPGALQTHQQEHFVHAFQMYLTHLRCVFQTVSTAEPNGPVPGSAHSPRAAGAHEAASSSHVHRLHTSTGQHAAGPDAAGSPSRELGPLQAAIGSSAEQADAVAAAVAPVGDDATAVSAAEAAGKSAVQADSASLAVVADCPAIEGSLQGQAWAEQPACSTAGSLEDSAFVGRDSSVSEGVVHQTTVQAAAGQQHQRFRTPWLMARGGSKASKVHAVEPARSAANRLEVLWSEDGFIKAGSKHNLLKGQFYRASPPGHLQEALARQRRLLHGQELRQCWNLPKVVDMIAAALEHAAKGCSGDSQLTQANAQYAPRPSAHDRPSASVAAQLAVIVAHGADQADVQAADSIALKVNCGTWDDLMAASPAALMQLLQLWFQSFQEPVLSISQQKTISCILGSYTHNTGIADVLFSPCIQAAEHVASDTAELSATQDAPPSQQQHAELCAAVAEHLSVPQKALIARLVRCFRALTGNRADDDIVYPLVQWLASALTVPQRQLDGLKDGLTAEQTALVFYLTHCDIGLLSPRTTGRCEAMPHADVVAGVIQTTDDSTKPCAGVSLQGKNSQKPCLVATEEQSQMPQGSHGQHADGGPQKMPSRDRGWDADEQGCLWLHSRMAKKALMRFVTLSGRTGAAAQQP